MKTVMIVDDEKPARELLKMLIDWESAGYTIISEARDGLEAMELYSRYSHDLVITDIQMPQMDGLLLIKEIKAINRDQNIIVLSCHENFSYAREVMKMGISDYLIKDSLTKEDLYAVLRNTLYQMTEENIAANSDKIISKKCQALLDIVSDRTPDGDYEKALEICELQKGSQYFFIHVITDSNTAEGYSGAAGSIIKAVTSKGYSICSVDNTYFIILVITTSSHSNLEMLNQRFTAAQTIRSIIEKITGGIVTVGVSQMGSDIGQLREKNLQARQALGYRVFLGKGKILFFDMVQNNSRNIKLELIDTRIKNIKAALNHKYQDILNNELKSLYMSELQGMMQYNYLQHVNALLLGLITTACTEYSIPYSSLFVDGTIPLDTIKNLETVNDMLLWFTEKFNALIKAIEDNSNDKYSRQVRKIVQYINQRFCEDIGLESISQEFRLHKAQLARIFKEDTGSSVNGYIRELRIEKAKALLKESDLNISEIVYEIGFQNFQSFYSAFKKQMGVTPMEFRDK